MVKNSWCKQRILQGDIPSQVGVREVLDEMDDTLDPCAQKTKLKEYFIGRTFVNVPRPRTEIKNYMKDCMSMFYLS